MQFHVGNGDPCDAPAFLSNGKYLPRTPLYTQTVENLIMWIHNLTELQMGSRDNVDCRVGMYNVPTYIDKKLLDIFNVL